MKPNKTKQDYITHKVKEMRERTTDRELASRLGMSRTTMYKRLKTDGWKLSEIALIEHILKFSKL